MAEHEYGKLPEPETPRMRTLASAVALAGPTGSRVVKLDYFDPGTRCNHRVEAREVEGETGDVVYLTLPYVTGQSIVSLTATGAMAAAAVLNMLALPPARLK